MYISIRPGDFSLGNLICLAQTLKESHPGWESAMIVIFSSHDAAKYYQLSSVENLPGAVWGKQLHAEYDFDAGAHEEYLLIMPLGDKKSSSFSTYTTRIDLPVATTPHCRLEMNGRCLFVLEDPEYPSDALKAKLSDTVTLTGTIARDGKMTSIEVADASSTSSEWKNMFMREAVNNLKTWRLEPAQRQDTIRITYSYTIDRSLPQRGQTDVQFALPNEIAIRGNPPD